jgi:hypothetical protein
MVVAVRARRGLRNERRLQRKRHRSRHHHDVGNPLKKGSFTAAQLSFPSFRRPVSGILEM